MGYFLEFYNKYQKKLHKTQFLQFLPEGIKLKNCKMLLGNCFRSNFAVNKRNLKQVFKQWIKTTKST